MKSFMNKYRLLVMRLLTTLGACIFLSVPLSANATVTFNIAFDNLGGNGKLDTIIGTGTLSYAGSLSYGDFALNTLSGLIFNTSFNNGDTFSLSDYLGNTSLSGIHVYDQGGGNAGFVFTGTGTGPYGGSADFTNPSGVGLSFEPTSSISNPIGCCGGNGVINEYYEPSINNGAVSDYYASTGIISPVPEPKELDMLLGGLGLIGFIVLRRKISGSTIAFARA